MQLVKLKEILLNSWCEKLSLVELRLLAEKNRELEYMSFHSTFLCENMQGILFCLFFTIAFLGHGIQIF